MTPALTGSPPRRTPTQFSWLTICWVAALLVICYGPVLRALLYQWYDDPDMGHGFFVPIIAGYIVWQLRDRIAEESPVPNWWGTVIMAWAGFQLYIATLGAELFLARTSLVISIIGAV